MRFENNLKPRSFEWGIGKGPVILFSAKPGDEVRGCGGAWLRHLEAGDQVSILKGPWMIREKDDSEAPNCNKVRHQDNGILDVEKMLGFECEDLKFETEYELVLEYGELLISQLCAVLARVCPVLVYAPYFSDQDQSRATLGLAAREAVRRHQEPCFLVIYEVGFPQQPDHFLDITKQLPKKQEALRYLCPHSDRSESAEVVMALNKIRGYTMGNGIEVAEAFKVVQVNELLNTPCKINICAEDIPNNKLAGSLVSIIIRTTNRVELADALDRKSVV